MIRNSFNMLNILKSGMVPILPGKRPVQSAAVFAARCYSDDSKILKNLEKKKGLEDTEEKSLEKPDSHKLTLREFFRLTRSRHVQIWTESVSVKREIKKQGRFKKVTNFTDFIVSLQSLRELPITPSEMITYLRKERIRKDLISQKYLPDRVNILKPDLAASHFLIRRGGSVKFLDHSSWKGSKGPSSDLPLSYLPGYFVEAIDAEGTNLCYEGLQNLADLPCLSWLSLKGLKDIDDWCLDWISGEYYENLTHLDISDCTSVTYRGLSCFYRFENLKTLNVKGISDTAEFKLACIMLQDIKPNLEIEGIDLSIPSKIEPVTVENVNSTTV